MLIRLFTAIYKVLSDTHNNLTRNIISCPLTSVFITLSDFKVCKPTTNYTLMISYAAGQPHYSYLLQSSQYHLQPYPALHVCTGPLSS